MTYDTDVYVSTRVQLMHAIRAVPYEGRTRITFKHRNGAETRYYFNGCPQKVRITKTDTIYYGYKLNEVEFDAHLATIANRIKRTRAYVWR